MNELQLLVDLHKRENRQGPGSDSETEKALIIAGLKQKKPLKIADIGCGTGASSLVLAGSLNARITAVDLFPDFLEILETRAKKKGLSDKISTLSCSMDNLPFADDEFDVIWSEGAIYNIGFEKGAKDWRRYLKAGGLLCVTEITWTTESRPVEIQEYWENEYPEIGTASEKLKILEKNGYSPLGYFVLPQDCWLENYYDPLQNKFTEFLERQNQSKEALALVEIEQEEASLYKRFKEFFSYGFYIAIKQD
ncbi:MAG: class I SAM-dependent methyltransferase [bacterium]|nr:class I SAM-dependent methyltransferase [bacterium]